MCHHHSTVMRCSMSENRLRVTTFAKSKLKSLNLLIWDWSLVANSPLTPNVLFYLRISGEMESRFVLAMVITVFLALFALFWNWLILYKQRTTTAFFFIGKLTIILSAGNISIYTLLSQVKKTANSVLSGYYLTLPFWPSFFTVCKQNKAEVE